MTNTDRRWQQSSACNWWYAAHSGDHRSFFRREGRSLDWP